MSYTVSEMANLLGIAPSTLRFYDKEGLLPFVERSKSGRRIFQEKDLEWMQVLQCLKKTRMPLKDIRSFIHLAMTGDETIRERLALFQNQRDLVRTQMAELQETLDTLDFKCWYYETAQAAGTTEVLNHLRPEDIPEHLRDVQRRLKTGTPGRQ